MEHSLGKIELKNLQIHCIVGILPLERKKTQDLFLDIILKSSFDLAEKTEDIHKTIDYAKLAHMVTKWVQQEKFLLIETLAKRGCQMILNSYPQAKFCKIKVKKPAAVKSCKYTSVTYSQTKND